VLKKLFHPIVLGIASIVFFVVGICCATAFDSELVIRASYAMLSIAGTLGPWVVVVSIVSLFARKPWTRRSSLLALALLACFGAWTAYRWKAVRWYGGVALLNTAEVDPAWYKVDTPTSPVIVVPDVTFTTQPGGVIGEEGHGTSGWFSSSTSQPHSIHSGATSRPAAGDFPIVELKYRDRTELVGLLADYGYIVDWPKGRKPSFYVFDRKRRSRFKTDRWERFIQELKRLPEGIEIDAVRRCTASFSYGMPRSKYKELRKVLDERSIRTISIDDLTRHVMFCYCETIDLRVLHDEDRQ